MNNFEKILKEVLTERAGPGLKSHQFQKRTAEMNPEGKKQAAMYRKKRKEREKAENK